MPEEGVIAGEHTTRDEGLDGCGICHRDYLAVVAKDQYESAESVYRRGYRRRLSGRTRNRLVVSRQGSVRSVGEAESLVSTEQVAASMWALKEPPTGSNTLLITQSAAHNITAHVMSFSGVDQNEPHSPAVVATGITVAPLVDVLTNTGEVVCAMLGVSDTGTPGRTVAPGANETERSEERVQAGGVESIGWMATQAGADGGRISPTISGAGTPEWIIMGVSVRPLLEWPRLLLPLMLDYAEEPRAGDRIRLVVEAPTGRRRRDAGGIAVEAFLANLRALKNASTTVTLTLHDVAGTPSSFTVLVEKIDSNESTLAAHPYREYPEAVAVIELRVV